MFSIIVTIIVIYLLVRFVFGFVIPVIIASNKVKKKMQEMNGFNQQQQFDQTPKNDSRSTSASPSKGDYLDYEEIR